MELTGGTADTGHRLRTSPHRPRFGLLVHASARDPRTPEGLDVVTAAARRPDDLGSARDLSGSGEEESSGEEGRVTRTDRMEKGGASSPLFSIFSSS